MRPLTRTARPLRDDGGPAPQVSPLRALAGAAVAVAGVALGIGALLSVTSTPEGSPALLEEPAAYLAGEPLDAEDLVEPGRVPADDLPAVPALAPTSPPPPPAPPVATAPPAPPAPPPVTVLNNSTRTGLAARAAARFRDAGWPVRLTGNFRGRLRATTVYYEPGQRDAAERFAATFRGVPRVLPRAGNIPGPRGLTVVLTRDFPA